MSDLTVAEDWNPGLTFAELTDVGMRRSNNQDSHSVVLADTAERFSQRGHLFIVADGMGAHAAGELASRMATDRIASAYFRAEPNGVEPTEQIDLLRQAVEHANDEIHTRGQQNPEFHNMGTTASVMAVIPAGAIFAHVGDSRAYRLRGKHFEQLTFDHSLVWEMEASGQVHPNSALGQSIPKNVITRSLGPNAEVQVDCEGPFPLEPGDVFLLCSDGLSGQVEDEEMGAILSCLPEDEAAQVLVDLANLRGGPDNSTVIITRVHETPDIALPEAPKWGSAPSTERVVSRLVPATVVACLLGALILGLAGMYQTMVIAVLLGLAAAITGIVQYQLTDRVVDARPKVRRSGGKGPYRRYSAEPTLGMHEKLKATVDDLRRAADEKHWELDWNQVQSHQRDAMTAAKKQQFADAVRHQAEAIIETMKQLREQHDRSANETAIDT